MGSAVTESRTVSRAVSWPWSIVTAAGIGCVWGLFEATLGTRLHASGAPLAGVVMIPIGICCALSARRFAPRPGMVMAAGLSAAAIKILAPGPFFIMPPLAILCEAALMEACLLLIGPNRVGFSVAGAAAGTYPLIHAFLIKTLFFGLPLGVVSARVLELAGSVLHLRAVAAPVLMTVWIAFWLVLGAVMGLIVGLIPAPSRRAADS